MCKVSKVCINSRCVAENMTGVSRYTSELMKRLKSIEPMYPNNIRHGVLGHFWEQFILPCRLRNRLLFSPGNTGPIVVSNQVVTIHDLATVHCSEFMSKKFSFYYSNLLPILVKNVRHIIAVSNFTKQCLISEFCVPEEKVSVVHNGVDSRFCPSKRNDIEDVLSILKLPCRKYILSVSSLEPRKNLTSVLNAWSKILHLLPSDLWLVIAGKQGNSNVFQDVYFNELPPRVFFTGYVEDELVPALISGAIFFIYMSFYEGFGLPPLEAMACGTPVLVSNQAALPEVVDDSGLYADPYDIDDIANKILLFSKEVNLRAKYSILGRERSLLFSWNKCAFETENILSKFE